MDGWPDSWRSLSWFSLAWDCARAFPRWLVRHVFVRHLYERQGTGNVGDGARMDS